MDYAMDMGLAMLPLLAVIVFGSIVLLLALRDMATVGMRSIGRSLGLNVERLEERRGPQMTRPDMMQVEQRLMERLKREETTGLPV